MCPCWIYLLTLDYSAAILTEFSPSTKVLTFRFNAGFAWHFRKSSAPTIRSIRRLMSWPRDPGRKLVNRPPNTQIGIIRMRSEEK